MRNAVVVETRTNKSKYYVGEEVELSVAVNNTGSNPVELIFTSAQHYDFVVLKDDNEVWRWSSGKVFAMVLEQLSLKPGEKQTYRETWKPRDAMPGEYKLTGIITSQLVRSSNCTFKIDK